MSLKEQICRDWRYMDGVFEGTVTAKSPRLADVTCASVKMLRGVLTRNNSQMFGGILFNPGDTLIEVWDCRDVGSDDVQVVLGREIEAGDTLTLPNGQVWTIHQSVYSDLTSRWSCRCNLGPRE
jgi:hypothetical protein